MHDDLCMEDCLNEYKMSGLFIVNKYVDHWVVYHCLNAPAYNVKDQEL